MNIITNRNSTFGIMWEINSIREWLCVWQNTNNNWQ